jgi:hypothetical protein
MGVYFLSGWSYETRQELKLQDRSSDPASENDLQKRREGNQKHHLVVGCTIITSVCFNHLCQLTMDFDVDSVNNDSSHGPTR